ncbi:IclR family transcriptional regulator [Amycolatopsis magusensis]|uniref:IclR family transcriptional regulator n=1 Tax=Amycolatopsis magusensis TaxID=882444 RepID=UPI00379301CF
MVVGDARAGVRPPSQPILVLAKSRRVIDVVAADPAGLTWRQVQRATGLPVSTTVRLLQNLVAEGFLDVIAGRYLVGLSVLRWARSRRIESRLTMLAQPELDALRDATGETAVLFVRHGDQRVLVGLAETRHEVVRLIGIGQVMPLHAGSAGKVFLAYEDEVRDRVLDFGELTSYTPGTIIDADRLRAELVGIQSCGWADSVAERDHGTASISAPVHDHTGELAAVLGIGVPEQRFTDANRSVWTEAVVTAARRLSAALGHAELTAGG